MTLLSVAERARVWRLLAHTAWQSILRWVHGGPLFRWRPFSGAPARLLIAPQDLRTADGTNAADIYAGRFVFAGQQIEANGRSPFEVEPPSRDWARALHGFGWLRHLKAADTVVARQNARALVDDWMRFCGYWHDTGWEQPVVARRVLAWLSQSPLILEDCDREFYRRFLRSLARQVRYLRRTMNETPDGVPRLTAAIAVAAATVSMSGQGRYVRQSLRRLDQELTRQILADGGHVSRNPAALLDILVDLLPVRHALTVQGLPTPQAVMQSIDRMMPMIRFFRHGDGAFAHFNGMGPTPADLVATILAYDDARGAPPSNAPHSGYQRLSAGDTVVLMETGCPPPPALSLNAHAGCLSFEMSSRRTRLIVNCGVSSSDRGTWRTVSRSTAAHSTATIDDTSSARFLSDPRYRDWLGAPIVAGPTQVPVTRDDGPDGLRVIASHNGYQESHRLLHERELTLATDGSVLDGIDRFMPTGKAVRGDEFALRFHLHPALKASTVRAGTAVLIVAPDGEAWEFVAPGCETVIEESIYLSDSYGHRRSEQIVVYGRVAHRREAAWQFRRTAAPQAVRRRVSDAGAEELDL
ncbi:heparinase II/III family protein [Stappia stellulata]|uniref:heparinase II/III family protein n=1 Tax=Stappia TaxID=152161 RepID=UPI001CD1A7D5|nr:heparinase II/III family protein [Stappia stellulata]MCA1242788.1 heparinase II/III family protein [Stappia stellulata]